MTVNPGSHIHHWAMAAPQPCGAKLPKLTDPGWECTGRGLIVVTTVKASGTELPVVLPARALEIVEPDSWWETPVRDFTGGDHLHLAVPRRPTGFRGDTPAAFGSEVLSTCVVGTITTEDGSSGMAFFGVA